MSGMVLGIVERDTRGDARRVPAHVIGPARAELDEATCRASRASTSSSSLSAGLTDLDGWKHA
jgi:hypothetical protein